MINDSRKLSNGRFEGGFGCFKRWIANKSRKKQTEFIAKTAFGLTTRRSTPPSAGPIIPEIFNCNPPSVEAEGSSSFETISG